MKRLLATILLLSLLTMPALAVTTPEEDELSLTAPSAVLMERTTGTLLYEKNGHERMSPASVTKIMTLLLIAELMTMSSVGVVGLGLILFKTVRTYGMGPSAAWRAADKKRLFAECGGSVLVLLLAGLCLFATMRLGGLSL